MIFFAQMWIRGGRKTKLALSLIECQNSPKLNSAFGVVRLQTGTGNLATRDVIVPVLNRKVFGKRKGGLQCQSPLSR